MVMAARPRAKPPLSQAARPQLGPPSGMAVYRDFWRGRLRCGAIVGLVGAGFDPAGPVDADFHQPGAASQPVRARPGWTQPGRVRPGWVRSGWGRWRSEERRVGKECR